MAQSKSNKCYGNAIAKLRETHREEFEELLKAEYTKAGLTYKRRLTPQERAARKREQEIRKAADTIAALQESYPELTTIPAVDTTPHVDGEQEIPFGGVHPVDPEKLAEFQNSR